MYYFNRTNVRIVITIITVMAYWLAVTDAITRHGFDTAISNNPYVLNGILYGLPLVMTIQRHYKLFRIIALVILVLLWLVAYMPLVDILRNYI
jgi:uncharacterized membrane protein